MYVRFAGMRNTKTWSKSSGIWLNQLKQQTAVQTFILFPNVFVTRIGQVRLHLICIKIVLPVLYETCLYLTLIKG